MVSINVSGNITIDQTSTFSINNYGFSEDVYTIDDFKGRWSGISPHHNSNGQAFTTKLVTLTPAGYHENIYYVTGKITWKSATNVGNDSSGEIVKTDSETVIGLYTGNNNLILVEQEEQGTYKGYLKKINNEIKLCLELTQPGPKSVVSYMELTKLP